jgi:hypothetical protein
MSTRITEIADTIDSKTSRSICGEIGERLRQNLVPEASELPASMQQLLDEMRRRECLARTQPRQG